MKTFVSDKIIITNIYRVQACDSVMCGYFRIGSINFIFKGDRLIPATQFQKEFIYLFIY